MPDDYCHLIFGTATTLGALLRWFRRSSVNPPRPMDVKKLIANLVVEFKLV